MQRRLRADRRLAIGGDEPPVGAIRVLETRFHVVPQNRGQDALHHALFERRGLDREHDLDAPEEVAWHPIRARQEDLGAPRIAEVEHAAVLEEAVDDADHTDPLGDARQARAQAAGAPNDQVDVDAGLRRAIQRVDD